MNAAQKPKLSCERLAPTSLVQAIDAHSEAREMSIAGELPLTVVVDGREIVTLMTLGAYPEELALGYLRNQYLIEDVADIESVKTDWERERVDLKTRKGKGIEKLEQKLANKTVTSGCGQGTLFSCSLDKLYDHRLPDIHLKQSLIYALLKNISQRDTIYKRSGAVHGCALCRNAETLFFVEDVGRHNAADAISGMMWLNGVGGAGTVLYTTGRLTSEIVMKAARMGIPALLSRSGITLMGLELARDLNVIMIARAKGKSFLVYNKSESIAFDAIPASEPRAVAKYGPARA